MIIAIATVQPTANFRQTLHSGSQWIVATRFHPRGARASARLGVWVEKMTEIP
jgi:hypothetical protein